MNDTSQSRTKAVLEFLENYVALPAAMLAFAVIIFGGAFSL